MRALVFENGQARYTTSHPEPAVKDNEVLIAVTCAGICSTDLEILKGYMGYSGVLGHEFVGVVVKGPRDLKDKRVVGEINCVCGKCDMCLSGLNNHCRERTTLGIKGHEGVFAEYVSLPRRNVHVLSDAVSNDQAVFVEPLAAALQIVKQVSIEPRHKVIVIGDGRLGLLTVQALAAHGGKGNVVLLGKHQEKLLFCEKRGIQGTHLDDMIFRPEWDIVVDCSGSEAGFADACRLVRPRGKIVLKSTWVATAPVDLSPLVINEITVIGSRCGPFPEAINALAADRVVVNGLITSRFPLAEGIEALEQAKKANQIKVVLDINQG
ncbi:MAG: alcohol dehydrogenase catalytic domain-containing protein [Sedimentisphaerales bacterium]|nr:alcohol dehydrogenase catalytic domain-containing protein [Sedimentisphaerales bacterium]